MQVYLSLMSRNNTQRNGWGGVRIYSGAGAQVQDNDLQGNQSGPLAIDKASQGVVVADNNQIAQFLPTGHITLMPLHAPCHSTASLLHAPCLSTASTTEIFLSKHMEQSHGIDA
jgi:hypothetical protein